MSLEFVIDISSNKEPRFLCGVDVGGNFTDLVLVDLARGTVISEKTPTTSLDPAEAIVKGLQTLRSRLSKDDQDSLVRVVHATTLVTNALIERRGARIGLLTTKGFADILDIQRENRYDIFDLGIRFPKPLVPREMRWEITERIDKDGQEVEPLDEDSVSRAAEEMKRCGIESIAIAFLHAYTNSTHEKAAVRVLQKTLGSFKYVSISGEVAPQIREFERFSTTTVNAYVMPIVDGYLAQLSIRVNEVWPGSTLTMMVSNGGICSPDTARRFPVRLVESGPVAGALVAAHFGRLAESNNLLAFDMGGTTAKLCVIRDGKPTMIAQFEADRTSRFKRGSGIPLLVPSVDLVEIGAGGGSIAWVDQLGLLQVGPQSASAKPGPACYGFGGNEPTVTDADLVLGYLSPVYFLGGKMKLDLAAAKQSLLHKLSARLNVDIEQAAWGIHELVNENMASAAWLHMAEKGLDPRTFVLVATGGAGPVHACHLALKLGIVRVLCPPSSGVASAFGLLIAPPKADVSQSFLSSLNDLDFDRLTIELEKLEKQALEILNTAAVKKEKVRYSHMADMLYKGQTHHIEVELPFARPGPADRNALANVFHNAYLRVYGTSLPEMPIDMVALRVTATAEVSPMATDLFNKPVEPVVESTVRLMYIAKDRHFLSVPVIRRETIPVEKLNKGPALIESADTTIVVDPGWTFSLGVGGLLVLEYQDHPSLDENAYD